MDSDAPETFPWTFVFTLSLAQLMSWGTIFYGFAVLLEPMIAELGWSRPEASAALSMGLVASAVAAIPVGRLIDLGYGRSVMTGGSVAAAALLMSWSRVENYGTFVVLCVLLGVTMGAVLYEPGFAVLQRRLGSQARRGITIMTLLGGLASTAFIPLTHGLIEGFGWRSALLALAGFNLICAAIHGLVVPPQEPRHRDKAAPPAPSNAKRVLGQAAFWGFVATGVIQGVLSTGMPMHLIALLSERGFTVDMAVAAYALFGPAQTTARFAVGWAERTLGIRTIGLITFSLGVAAQVLLHLVPPGSWTIVGFVLLYGASNGLVTIVRAVLPADLFGREDYGTIMGMIAAPVNLARALGPLVFGALWAWWGSYDAVILACLAMAIASLGAYLFTLATAKPVTS